MEFTEDIKKKGKIFFVCVKVIYKWPFYENKVNVVCMHTPVIEEEEEEVSE